MSKEAIGHDRRRKSPATGVARGNSHRGFKRVVVAFDPETFDEVRNRAIAAGRSFAAEVRDLVEWGLEA